MSFDSENAFPDEREPRQGFGYLHPTSLIFDIISHVRSLIVPAIIAVFSAAQGSVPGLIFAGVIFFPTLMFSIIRYFTLRFRIQDGELVVTEGLIFHRVRTVPVRRIQNIDLIQNVLHRIFGVAEVRVETASGTEAEAMLRVLSVAHVEHLRNSIFAERQHTESRGSDASEVADQRVPGFNQTQSQELLKIPGSSLFIAGLASNKGMILIGVLLGACYQFDLWERFDLKQLAKMVPDNLGTAWNTILISGIVIAVLIFLRVLGIIWYFLRFYDYRLVRIGDDLRISCGLLTNVSATVPRKRIQFISIHRNLVMRFMGLASVRIETAGGAGKDNQDAAKTVSSRWFVPVIPDDRVAELLNQLRPGLNWSEESLVWHSLAPRARVRLSRLAVIQSVVIALIGIAIARPWGWIAGFVALPFLIWLAVKQSRAMRYARMEDGVIYRSGVLTKKTSFTFFEKIQTLRVAQSPFDRRWKMATLSVDTAAAGPAEHTISIPYLPQGFAHTEYDKLVQKASSHQPVFG